MLNAVQIQTGAVQIVPPNEHILSIPTADIQSQGKGPQALYKGGDDWPRPVSGAAKVMCYPLIDLANVLLLQLLLALHPLCQRWNDTLPGTIMTKCGPGCLG